MAKQNIPNKESQLDDHNQAKPVLPILIGAFIGFIAASVLYSQHLPLWVPRILSGSPVIFFGLFIIVTGVLGYIWGTTETARDHSTKEKKKIPTNTMFTSAFIGFLVSVVLFSKYMPSWVPLIFMEYPVVFFVLFAVIGSVIGFFWAKTEPENPNS